LLERLRSRSNKVVDVQHTECCEQLADVSWFYCGCAGYDRKEVNKQQHQGSTRVFQKESTKNHVENSERIAQDSAR